MLDNLHMLSLIIIIGIGLVLSTNILLCALLVAILKITIEKNKLIRLSDNQLKSDTELREKVAVAAAAAAIEINNAQMKSNYTLPLAANVSAWQAVMRSDILKRHNLKR